MHRDELQSIKKDLDDPVEYQARDKIKAKDKLVILFANEYFSDEYIGMANLPPVNDDFNNILQTVQMLNIP